jgi:serine/alanine racemase
MFFLFEWLLYISSKLKKQNTQKFKDIALWMYILHPLCIIIIRGAAKVAGQTHTMVNNSLIHYILVCMLSFISAVILTKIINIVSRLKLRRFNLKELNLWRLKLGKQNAAAYPKGRAWLEIDFNNLQHNVNELKRVLPESCELMPAVKANAYGHGIVEIARKLRGMGINHYCVACALEGVELRKAGVKGEVLIFGYTAPEQFDLLRKYNLTQTIVDAQYGLELKKYGKKLSVHIAIDTGMHRLGIPYNDKEGILTFLECNNLSVTGIYSHLCVSDSYSADDREFTWQQIKRFDSALKFIKDAGYTEIKAHLQSSYGILNYPELYYDFARPGIALYGILSSSHDTCVADVNLKPVLALKSKIESVKFLKEGESAGYGLAYTAEHEMLLAVASIGYADGVPRKLSCENGYVLLHGKKVPIVGRVCMDQMLIDVTAVRKVKPGDEIVIIGKSGEQEITACDIARWAGTISNEILSRLGKRLERVYVE